MVSFLTSREGKELGLKELNREECVGHINDDMIYYHRQMFEDRIKQVSAVIDKYEIAHISTKSKSEIRRAIQSLHAQNLILMRAADEEQLVDR